MQINVCLFLVKVGGKSAPSNPLLSKSRRSRTRTHLCGKENSTNFFDENVPTPAKSWMSFDADAIYPKSHGALPRENMKNASEHYCFNNKPKCVKVTDLLLFFASQA